MIARDALKLASVKSIHLQGFVCSHKGDGPFPLFLKKQAKFSCLPAVIYAVPDAYNTHEVFPDLPTHNLMSLPKILWYLSCSTLFFFCLFILPPDSF